MSSINEDLRAWKNERTSLKEQIAELNEALENAESEIVRLTSITEKSN